MKHFILIFILTPLLCFANAGGDLSSKERLDELKKHQAKWQINKVSLRNYQLKLNHFSPAVEDYSSVFITATNDGHVYDYQVYNYDELLSDYNLSNDELITVNFLFDKVERAIASQPGDMIVEYNDKYGFPEKVYLKYKDANEELVEHTIHVTDFIPNADK